MKKEVIYVIGHKHPDTDSICASIAYANLKQKEGINAKPFRCGKVNNETKFVLDYFNVEAPKLIKNASGKKLILVDHNEEVQAVDDIKNAEILEIIDHHMLGHLQINSHIFADIEPIGCTSTIIAELYFNKNIKLNKKMAGILASAILSDTEVFKSPTTTERDKRIVKKLSKIAGISPSKFGFKLEKIKSDLSGKTPKRIIDEDLKEYEAGANEISISQVEVMDDEEINKLKDELLKELENMRDKNHYLFSVLAITDIEKEFSRLWIAGKKEIVEKAFNKKFENDEIILPGVISRKKQIAPPIEKIMESK